MGPVEKAVREKGLATLKTIAREVSFKLAEFSTEGLVLEVGQGGWRIPISWPCLEEVPQFLGESKSGVRINGDLSCPAPDTLDGYLKTAGVQRRAGNYVAAVLVEAGIVEAVCERSWRIRLRSCDSGTN